MKPSWTWVLKTEPVPLNRGFFRDYDRVEDQANQGHAADLTNNPGDEIGHQIVSSNSNTKEIEKTVPYIDSIQYRKQRTLTNGKIC